MSLIERIEAEARHMTYKRVLVALACLLLVSAFVYLLMGIGPQNKPAAKPPATRAAPSATPSEPGRR